MIEFFNSNGFQTLVTFIVGLAAYIIYKVQKNDEKVNAARSIVLEIQNAEKGIGKVRDAVKKEHLDVDVKILQSESWSSMKRYFVRDFDTDEWDVISDFFNKASLLDAAIAYNKTAFASDVEQIRSNKQAALARYAAEAIEGAEGKTTEKIRSDYDLKARAFDGLYMDKQGDFAYNPLKPLNDARMYLEGLGNLSTTTIGQKFKKMAKLK